ncbi:MAG: glycerophosphodiester phosphodiesterase family protein [Boseongicola sp.]|nr:glycerophosphodiester phosphodiesterase family protein [Boseongicola sp.]
MKPLLRPAFLTRPIAHRGLHNSEEGRPENSRAAAVAAIRHGYGIELDLQLSADGQAMVFHDYALDRLTNGKGAVRQHTASSLSILKLNGCEEGIPTLKEFLTLVSGRVPLLIELKDQDGALGSNVGELEQATAEALDGYEGDVALMSFNPYSAGCFQALAPEIPRGLVTETFLSKEWPVAESRLAELTEIPDFMRTGASFISHNVRDLDSKRVRELKDQGASILCWTVRSPEDEVQARKVVHNITFEGYLA